MCQILMINVMFMAIFIFIILQDNIKAKNVKNKRESSAPLTTVGPAVSQTTNQGIPDNFSERENAHIPSDSDGAENLSDSNEDINDISQPGKRPHAVDTQAETGETAPKKKKRGPDSYEITQVKERTFAKTGAVEKTYKVILKDDWKGDSLKEVRKELRDMFDKTLQMAKGKMAGADRGRVMIEHNLLKNPIVVPLQPLQQLTSEVIMNVVENVLNSNDSLSITSDFAINIGLIENPSGGGPRGGAAHGHRIRIINEDDLITKRCVIWNRDFNDDLCLHRAIVLAWLYANRVSTAQWHDMSTECNIAKRKGDTFEKILAFRCVPKYLYKENAHK